MKTTTAKSIAILVSAGSLCLVPSLVAQPAAGPLAVQALDQFVLTGARSRAMGGTGIASGNDVSTLFSNPAALSQLQSFEIRAGGFLGQTHSEQTQAWVPLKTLPGISVLFEGLTGSIKTPVDTAGNPLSPWNTLQKPYDTIGPNWYRSVSTTQPLTLAAALPFTLAGVNITAGLGYSQVIDVDSYFQNNNAMTPYLGQERPYGQWSNATDTLHVKWYQFVRSRDGSVYGVTPGISVAVLSGLVVGGSATLLSGSSDDLEQRVERGHLNIAIGQGEPKDFMLDTAYYYQTKKGTSTYRGTIFTFGLLYQQARFGIGLTVKPAMTLTRSWDREVTSIDTTMKPFPVRIDSLTARSYHESGTEDLRFPLAYAVGIVLKPTDDWAVALDYEVRNLADVELTSQATGTPSHPWANNKAQWRLGAEYRPSELLALRGGYRQDIQATVPDGAGLTGEPARSEVFCLGAGFRVGGIILDLAYEYAFLKYQDIYQSNINTNSRVQHHIIAEIAFRL